MRFLLLGVLALASFPHMTKAQTKPKSVHDFQVTTIDGEKVDLAKYKGKVLLIVNVASECGYTDQYKPLQALHAKYAKDGLVILAFPCNDFGAQEPGSNADIKKFARKNYGVEFELFSKIKVLGKDAAPLYKFLTANSAKPGDVKWNFGKFLIGRDGKVLARSEPNIKPDSSTVTKAVEDALAKK